MQVPSSFAYYLLTYDVISCMEGLEGTGAAFCTKLTKLFPSVLFSFMRQKLFFK
jgi:hypothetical protein